MCDQVQYRVFCIYNDAASETETTETTVTTETTDTAGRCSCLFSYYIIFDYIIFDYNKKFYLLFTITITL